MLKPEVGPFLGGDVGNMGGGVAAGGRDKEHPSGESRCVNCLGSKRLKAGGSPLPKEAWKEQFSVNSIAADGLRGDNRLTTKCNKRPAAGGHKYLCMRPGGGMPLQSMLGLAVGLSQPASVAAPWLGPLWA